MKRVLTIGTFDLLHPGHIELLEGCRELADGPFQGLPPTASRGMVVVAVNREAFVRRFKGKDPIVPLWGRMLMLSSLRQVDNVIVNMGDEQASTVIAAVGPDVIAIGSDWLGKDYLGQLGVTQDWLDQRQIEIVYIPRTTTFSTTGLRATAALDTSDPGLLEPLG